MTDAETQPGIACPACGTANEPESRFCQECGAPLAPTPAEPAPAPVTSPEPEAVARPTVGAAPASDPAPEPQPRPRPQPTVPAGAAPNPVPERSTEPSAVLPPVLPRPAARPGSPATPAAVPSPRRGSGDDKGNWLTSAPARSVLIVGLILLLGSCLLLVSGQDALREPLEPLLFCAGPVGLLLVAVALVRLLAGRPAPRR